MAEPSPGVVCHPCRIPLKNNPMRQQWGIRSRHPLEQGMTVKVVAQDGRWKVTRIAHVVKWLRSDDEWHYGILSQTWVPYHDPEPAIDTPERDPHLGDGDA